MIGTLTVQQPVDSLATSSISQCRTRPHSFGLLVVFHDIWPTIFESQVLVHAQEMQRVGIQMEVWVFAARSGLTKSAAVKRNLQERYDIPIRLFRAVRSGIPFAEIRNALRLARALRHQTRRIDFIHARTDYATLVCGLVRLFRSFDLIWDCRGDAVAEFRESASINGHSPMRSIKSKVLQLHRAAARQLSNKAIFVSGTLKSKCLPDSDRRPVEVIPCVASPELFYFSPELRSRTRRELGISAAQTVFAYAGSITNYQCFDEVVSLFRMILESHANAVLLVVTPQKNEAVSKLSGIPEENLRIASGHIEHVNAFLNAADFGLFLRKRSLVNVVASPLKFAEYSLVGLPVIMTDAVAQSASFGRILGNAEIIELGQCPKHLVVWPDHRRSDVAERALRVLARPAVLEKYLDLYSCR